MVDLATTGETQLVTQLGVDPARCIHTHPIKRDIDIRNALHLGVKIFVADNPDEVRKFEPYRDQAELLLRVSFRSPGAVVDLSRKFGCDPEDLIALARLARKLAIPVRRPLVPCRLAGARCTSNTSRPSKSAPDSWRRRRREKLGFFDTLDIGGGYPIEYGQKVADIGRFCAPIRAALAKLPGRLRVIAEPGRYICGPAAIGVASVMGRRAPRRPLVVLPRRRPVRLVLRPACSTTPSIRWSRSRKALRNFRRCSPAPPATASMSSRKTSCCRR